MTDCIDFSQGLRHCDNQYAIYSAVLAQFKQQYQQGLDIDAMLNDPQHALLELHSLKGLCSTIGAAPLSSAALAAYQQWPALNLTERGNSLQQLQTQLQQLVQELDPYLIDPPP